MSSGSSFPLEGVQVITAANASPYTLGGTNTYLLGGPRAVVIDPGPDDPAHVQQVLARAHASTSRISLILVTHGHTDHLGAARRLAEATGAPVGRWRAGERPLEDGQVLEADAVRLRVHYTPGHAPDHVAFHWADRRALFSGDLVLGSGTVVVAPPGGSMTEYLRSLDRMARLDLAVIGPGHGPPITDPAAVIAEYAAHRRMREQQVLAALAPGPRTPGEIVGVVYESLDPRLHPAAEGTVLAHLVKLLDEGRVRREGNRYYLP